MAVALAGVPVVFWPGLYDDFTLPKQAVLLAAGGIAAAAVGWGGRWRTMPGWLAAVLAGWALVLLLSTALALDWRGSILGYYQYRQGLATQLAYLALFAGGWVLATSGRLRVFGAGLVGLAGAFLYTVVQSSGNDPFTWWLDTSDRAIGTIGNANELAAFAVIAMGLAAFVPARRFAAAAAVTWGAVLFIVLEAESRSGLAAVVLFFLLLPLAMWLGGQSLRPLLRSAPAVAAALIFATAASLAAGGLEGTATRVSGEAGVAEAGGSTRLALWEGTLHVVAERPLLGVGPDGLHLGFPQWRPEGLGGAYATYDLVAQSSHDYVLDTAANSGLVGLALLTTLVAGCAVASVRATRRSAAGDGPQWPVAWAAMGAYGALALLNPTSLAAHALFFALLGAMAGAALARRHEARRAPWSLVVGAPLAAAGIGLGVALPLADLRAQAAWDAFAAGRFEEAAREYRAAGRLVPFERDYARRETASLLAAGAVDGGVLVEAEERLRQFDERFGFASGDAFNLAAVLIGQGRPPGETLPFIARAVALNPHGVATASYGAQLVRAAHDGGVLVHDDEDHWTYVVPHTPPAGDGLR
jgi:O-antigen ligase